MILRFYLYSIFKNLRFADPFLVLFLLDLRLSLAEIGLLLGMQHLVTVLLEFPSGILADYWGRRSATALCFVFYAIAFLGFGRTQPTGASHLMLWLSGCLTTFGLGEALRTGSHKAIILDYLDLTGQSQRATQIIGRTRAVSKYASATAAVSGGVILSWSREYSLLFDLSAISAVCGFLLMLTYPRDSEGEVSRSRKSGAPASASNESARKKSSLAGFWSVFFQSVLFESQLKIILKYFTQPFLKAGLGLFGIPILAAGGLSGVENSGAFWVGLNEFVRDGLGGLGARLSPRFQRAAGNGAAALNLAYRTAFVAVFGLAICGWKLRWGLIPGLVILVALTILQNLRRPIFVSTLNLQMPKTQRASLLSLESFSRAISVSLLLPLFGWAADHFGLFAVWGLSSLILLAGLMFQVQDPPTPAPSLEPTKS